MKLCPELMPILKQLQSEGYKVYTYKPNEGGEYHSLFWFEGGRVLDIQPTQWRNARSNRDSFRIGTQYVPSAMNGSGCLLSAHDNPTPADSLLGYRREPTWVSGVQNYKSMEHYLKSGFMMKKILLNEKGEG